MTSVYHVLIVFLLLLFSLCLLGSHVELSLDFTWSDVLRGGETAYGLEETYTYRRNKQLISGAHQVLQQQF